MKLSQKEIFILELEKDELEFFLQVVDQISLSKDSSPLASEICEKFKNLKRDLTNLSSSNSQPPSSLECDGCSALTATIQTCPTTHQQTPLCTNCFQLRQSYSSV